MGARYTTVERLNLGIPYADEQMGGDQLSHTGLTTTGPSMIYYTSCKDPEAAIYNATPCMTSPERVEFQTTDYVDEGDALVTISTTDQDPLVSTALETTLSSPVSPKTLPSNLDYAEENLQESPEPESVALEEDEDSKALTPEELRRQKRKMKRFRFVTSSMSRKPTRLICVLQADAPANTLPYE